MKSYARDFALWFFGFGILFTLLVSMPSTYAIAKPFHRAVELTLFVLFVLEFGQVGSKLAQLAVPQWKGRLNALAISLLVLTTLANYADAADTFATAELSGTLLWVRQQGLGWLAAIGMAAIFPVLLFVFLTAFVARVVALRHERAQRDAGVARVRRWKQWRASSVARRWRSVRHAVAQMTQQRDAALALVTQQAEELRQRGDELAQLASALEETNHDLRQLEDERRTRPALPDAESVTINGAAFTVRQLATRLEMSEATVRRRLKG
jgi:hypothetical protein